MDTRDTPEQAELRRSAGRLARELAPARVADLDDPTRSKRLGGAVHDAGWLELRDDAGDGSPVGGGAEAAIVADALGGAVADVAFAGPVLAGDLARRAGARAGDGSVVAFSPSLTGAAVVDGASTSTPVYAVDATEDHIDSAYVLVREGADHRLARVSPEGAVGSATRGADLTRAVCVLPAGAPVHAVPEARRLLTDEDLAAWTALGLALTSADLVGVMRGVLDVTVAYAAERRQYGVAIGSFQAVQHLLAEARCLMEGSLSVALHASWAVDNLDPDDARAAGRVAKAYCARAARTVCETAVQVHGGIGNTWECIAHVYLRRALLSSQWFGDDGEQLQTLARERLEAGDAAEPLPEAGRRSGIDHGGGDVAEALPEAGRRSGIDHGGGDVAEALPEAGRRSGIDLRSTFRDSPPEAEFRVRLRAWLVDNNPGLPSSSTDDEYWARQAEWHTSLYDAGFFGLSWPARYGGHALASVFDVILDEELAAAGAPPRPSLGYLVQGITVHGSDAIKERFLPGLISGRERWCQGFSEPDAGSDLAALRTTATRDGDDYVIDGHKVWTSYSDVADWCFLLARTDPDVPKHKGLSAFALPMDQPGIEQRSLRMINGITTEFGQVLFDGARVAAANMIGEPGEGWRVAMTIVSHEREPGELGYVSRYAKTVKDLEATVRADPEGFRSDQREAVAWAYVQAEMLRLHVCRRLSERLDGVEHGPGGSIDKLLMTWVEQTVGTAALTVSGSTAATDAADVATKIYLYSRAQSVMGGTSQIQKNIIATRILGLPTA